jgi:hypothetical protein
MGLNMSKEVVRKRLGHFGYVANPEPCAITVCLIMQLRAVSLYYIWEHFLFPVILRSRGIMARLLMYVDGLAFSLPFTDLNWSHIYRWTFVNVYFRHAYSEVRAGVGTEYWLLESSSGHTINCVGTISQSSPPPSSLYTPYTLIAGMRRLTEVQEDICFLKN